MKPAPFDYVRAGSLEEALEALAGAGADARIVAGGQSLLPMLNMRLARPGVLVDIMRLANLRRIEERGGEIVIGAGVRQAELEAWPRLADTLPLVAAMLPLLGHVQTRSRGTVCGSIAHADPSAELPLALVALGGAVHLRSQRARRRVAAGDFFAGMMATDMADDEMIEAVSFPAARPGTGHAFREVARRHGDFAIVACAAVVDGTVARLAVGGVADRPVVRAMPMPDEAGLDDALNEFAWDLDARDDVHATARYRRDLVRAIGRQVLEEAARCRD
ncbi:FAD binding domain-containing protein [Microbaculum marinum]|uniref:FAD binding domain-containing protein n=1 Tax=Microbaculum marinum TaxID=1764581 RepID=A0AAW9RHS0_9HYPH